MSTSRLELGPSWAAGGRITAAANIALLIRNTNTQKRVWFALTTDDTAPSFTESLGHVIEPGEQIGMSLKTGERIWFATESGDFAITITEGEA